MIPILVESDDVRSGRKAKARHGRHRSQWVNGTQYQVRVREEEKNTQGMQHHHLREKSSVTVAFFGKPPTVGLSMQVYKWVLVNLMLGLIQRWIGIPPKD